VCCRSPRLTQKPGGWGCTKIGKAGREVAAASHNARPGQPNIQLGSQMALLAQISLQRIHNSQLATEPTTTGCFDVGCKPGCVKVNKSALPLPAKRARPITVECPAAVRQAPIRSENQCLPSPAVSASGMFKPGTF
jgi:hypothetical protein